MHILNIFYNRWNFGDKASTPIHYFNDLKKVAKISSIHLDDLKKYNLSNYHIIVGGGGILSISDFESSYKHIFDSKPKTTAAWGAGYHGIPFFDYNMNKVPRIPLVDKYEHKFDLHSTRDYCFKELTNWTPCSSCMFDGFDMQVDKKREIGVFLHAEMNPHQMTDFHKLPHIYNDPKIEWKDTLSHFEKVIKFFKESNIVVTNSFHGTYWAIMTNVPVISLAFSTKFFHLKWQPVFANENNWKDYIDDIDTFPNALSEARTANIQFYHKYKSLVSEHSN